jgi:hypothetical protein
MGYVIPVQLMERKDIVSFMNTVAGKALELGKQLIDAKELTIRTLAPTDLG